MYNFEWGECMVSSHLNSLDFYADRSLVAEPCPYFDELRQHPVQEDPRHEVVMAPGYGEATIPPLDALIAAWACEWLPSHHATALVLEM
jgi:hypothetical protein